jgi:hypothetical protein
MVYKNNNYLIMKTIFLPLILICTLCACQKETVTPASAPDKTKVTSTSSSTTTSTTTSVPTQNISKSGTLITAANDTIPEMAGFKLKLVKDNTNYDEVLFMFKKESSANYDAMEDGKYLAGNGQVSLASISGDGTDLATNSLPYSPGMHVDLDANAKSDGAYKFDLSFQIKIPSDVHIWLKDNLLKDSVDMRISDYSFNISRADATTFGSKRFELIIQR